MRPFTVTLVGCYGRFGLNSAEFLGANSSSTYTSVAVQLQLHRWRGEGGVCTWRVLRVPRQDVGTQTGLLVLGPGGDGGWSRP